MSEWKEDWKTYIPASVANDEQPHIETGKHGYRGQDCDEDSPD